MTKPTCKCWGRPVEKKDWIGSRIPFMMISRVRFAKPHLEFNQTWHESNWHFCPYCGAKAEEV